MKKKVIRSFDKEDFRFGEEDYRRRLKEVRASSTRNREYLQKRLENLDKILETTNVYEFVLERYDMKKKRPKSEYLN